LLGAVLGAQVKRCCKEHKRAGMEYLARTMCEKCHKLIMRAGYKQLGDKRIRWCESCKPADAITGRPVRD
jgi:hypothetical protein